MGATSIVKLKMAGRALVETLIPSQIALQFAKMERFEAKKLAIKKTRLMEMDVLQIAKLRKDGYASMSLLNVLLSAETECC